MNFNPKRFFSIGTKVVANTQVIMLLGMLGVIIYLGGYENAYKGNIDKLTALDKQIQEKRADYEKKRQEAEKLKQFEKELKGIETEIPELKKGDAVRIAALTESNRITDLAKGIGRDAEKSPILPPPNDKVELLDFVQVAETTVDVVEELAVGNGQAQAKKKKKPKKKKAGEEEKPEAAESASVNLTRFDYDMTIRGTYPAVADVLNQLVQSKNLVVINKVLVAKSGELKDDTPGAKPPAPPAPKSGEPEGDMGSGQANVDMKINLSLFFYVPSK